jgi:hypothetical protein
MIRRTKVPRSFLTGVVAQKRIVVMNLIQVIDLTILFRQLRKIPEPNSILPLRESENENDKVVSFFNCATAPSALQQALKA